MGFKGLVPKTCHMSLSSISLRLSDASASLPSPSLCPAMYAKLPECASTYMYLCTHARVFAFAYVYSMHVSSCSAPSRRHEQPEHPRADVFSLSLSVSVSGFACCGCDFLFHPQHPRSQTQLLPTSRVLSSLALRRRTPLESDSEIDVYRAPKKQISKN